MKKAAAQIAAAFVVWSTWSLFIRELGMPGWWITFYVGGASLAVSCAGVLVFEGRKGFRTAMPRAALAFLGIATLATNVLFFSAFQLTTVANAIFSHYMAPVLVAVFAPIVVGEPRLRTAPFAIALSLAGMAFLVPSLGFEFTGTHLLGLLCGFASAGTYAAIVILCRRHTHSLSGLAYVFYVNIFIVLGLAPWAATAPMPTLAQWRLIVVLGIVHATFIPALFFRALRWASAQLSSILGYIEPLSAVALAAVFLGEIPEAKALLGGVLILFAGFLAVREELGRETAVVPGDAVR